MWDFLGSWRTVFDRFDTDRSGNISASELTLALQEKYKKILFALSNFNVMSCAVSLKRHPFISFKNSETFFISIQQLGYHFSQHFVPILMQKFDFHKSGSLQFDGFVHSILMIRRLTAAFQPYDTYRKS